MQNHKLARVTPESVGLDPTQILALLEALGSCELHSLMIARQDQVAFEGYWDPYSPDEPHVIHSLTKIFTIAAAGIAYTEGLFDPYGGLDARAVDVLADFTDEAGRTIRDLHRSAFAEGDESAFETSWARLGRVTLRDLMAMRSGAACIMGNQWRPLRTSWLADWFGHPMQADPGTEFLYSSGNTYVVSAMVQAVSGQTAHALLGEHAFPALGMCPTWSLSPEGIASGGNGVTATTEDLLKIGLLYLNGGVFEGTRILSQDWCHRAIGLTPCFDGAVLRQHPSSYAFHWRARAPLGEPGDGTYTAGGMFGQLILIDPQSGLVIAATAGTEAEIRDILTDKLILPARQAAIGSRTAEADTADLADRAAALTLWPGATRYCSPATETIETHISGKTYRAETEATYTGTLAEGDRHLLRIPRFGLCFTGDFVDFTLVDDRGTHTVRAGRDTPHRGTTTMTGGYMHHQYVSDPEQVVALARWTGDDRLQLIWRYPNMAFADTVTVRFVAGGDRAEVLREVNVTSEVKSLAFAGRLTDELSPLS